MSRAHDLGDGDPCPVSASHGRMLMSKDKRHQYCPHQSHDKTGEPAHYQYDGKTPRKGKA